MIIYSVFRYDVSYTFLSGVNINLLNYKLISASEHGETRMINKMTGRPIYTNVVQCVELRLRSSHRRAISTPVPTLERLLRSISTRLAWLEYPVVTFRHLSETSNASAHSERIVSTNTRTRTVRIISSTKAWIIT